MNCMSIFLLLFLSVISLCQIGQIDASPCTCTGYLNYATFYPKATQTFSSNGLTVESPGSIMSRMNLWIQQNNLSSSNMCSVETLHSPIQLDSSTALTYNMPNYYVIQTTTYGNSITYSNYITYYEYYKLWYCSNAVADYSYNPSQFQSSYGGNTVQTVVIGSASTDKPWIHLYMIYMSVCAILVMLN